MSDESFLFGDDEETPSGQDNQSFTDLRKHASGLDKKLKATTKELEELRAFKTSYEAEQAEHALSKTFDELGVDPKRARWFKADNPEVEVTKDAVAAWAIAEGFLEASGVETPNTTTGFVPTVVQEGRVDAKTYTAEEIQEMYRIDPDKVKALYAKGRIKLDKLSGSAAFAER